LEHGNEDYQDELFPASNGLKGAIMLDGDMYWKTYYNISDGIRLKVDGFAHNHGSFGFAIVEASVRLWYASSTSSSATISSSTTSSRTI
jgi:hypothetical protein